MKNPNTNIDPAVSAAAAILGRKGGQVTGPCKARHITSERARHAINARWARYRAAQSPPSKSSK